MKKPLDIIMLVYDGFELLDLSGPTSVFNAANSISKKSLYAISVLSEGGGAIRSSCGIETGTQPLTNGVRPNSTVLVVGAEGQDILNALKRDALLRFLSTSAGRAMRCGSVCSGAFVLAASGVLKGRNAATHWAGCQKLQTWYPDIFVDADALYVIDGSIWTSAGVTTGIDIALAMIEADLVAELKNKIARHLVVYAHRPGSQTQFSTVLAAQITAGDPFAEVLGWIERNLPNPIKVADMADFAGMTERSFQRKFSDTLRMPPARYLKIARLEMARQLLAAQKPVKTIFREVGFASEAAFRTAFRAYVGTTPTHYAAMQT
jgi:transcriptional regulator GlxA family with amidase domain